MSTLLVVKNGIIVEEKSVFFNFRKKRADGAIYVEVEDWKELERWRQASKNQKKINALTASLQGLKEKLLEAGEEDFARDIDGVAEDAQAMILMANDLRLAQAQRVMERLKSSGWTVDAQIKAEEGTAPMALADDLYLYLEKDGKKASVTFTIEGEVRVDSAFDEDGARSRREMQEIILLALAEGGARRAHGHCVTGEDPEELWAQELLHAAAKSKQTAAASRMTAKTAVSQKAGLEKRRTVPQGGTAQ